MKKRYIVKCIIPGGSRMSKFKAAYPLSTSQLEIKSLWKKAGFKKVKLIFIKRKKK